MEAIDQNNSGSRTPSAIIIPRPKHVHISDKERQDDSYHTWMQEYHRHHQELRNHEHSSTPFRSPRTKNTPDKDLTTHHGSNRLKGSNLFLNFNALSIGPYNENPVPLQKKQSKRMEAKIDDTDTLDGYRIYKGSSGYLTLGLSKQNSVSTVDQSKSVDFSDSHSIPPSYAPFILPDKFILTTSKPHSQKAGYKVGHSHYNHHYHHPLSHTSKITATTVANHFHPQGRIRPHSASSSDTVSIHSYTESHKGKKGTKSKGSLKKVKPLPHGSYRAPTITRIQLHSDDAISATPRHNDSISTSSSSSSYKLDQNGNLKTDRCPKSILKNHKQEDNDEVTTSQASINKNGKYPKTLSSTYPKIKHEFCHEVMVSPGRVAHAIQRTVSVPTSSNGHGSISHQASSAAVIEQQLRPRSAAATSSKYELLDRATTPRRKSVTFNSYVSFLSENRVSTIRSLPVDVGKH